MKRIANDDGAKNEIEEDDAKTTMKLGRAKVEE